MDFSLDDGQVALQDTMRRFCDQEFPVHLRGMATSEETECKYWQALAEMGVLGLCFAEEFGGGGLGPVETMLVTEELGRALVGGRYIESAVFCGSLIDVAGSPAQRNEWLGALAMGRLRPILAGGKVGAGDTAVATAQRLDGRWRLDGAGIFVPYADTADLLLIVASVADGIRLFALRPDQKGLSLQPGRMLDGSGAATLILDGVIVGDDALLAATDDTEQALAAARDAVRAALCADHTGALTMLLDLCIEQLKTRRQFGRPLAEFQALQHRLADLFIGVEQARSMSALAAMAVAEASPVERERLVAAATVLIGETGRHVGEWAIQLHGAMGMTEECSVGRYARRLIASSQRFGRLTECLRTFGKLS